ncbi:restriction endonuclease subunit S [Flavobacterium sp. FlaQc-52]|uniref:restriction endonuclease subunit S n=1 Tax=Flavobacterium sp. FlaQc-52 TaxID=3374185 RepID=UPI003756AAA4
MDKKNKNPAIRFKGFTEDWVHQELGDFLTERKEMQKISEDAPILAFASGQGVIDRSERKSNNRDHLTLDQENKVYKLTEFNDIVYNPSNLKYGAIDRNKHKKGVISPIYITFTTKEEPSFMELIVKSEKFKLRALQYEEGTVVKRQSVKPENLLSLKIVLSSSLNEQKQIGTFFQNLDNLISLNQKKHDKLVVLKKAMLVKMFPKKDAVVPEIRFKGFTEDWKVKEIRELASVSTGYPFDSKTFTDKGEYLVITNGNIQNNSSTVDNSKGNRINIYEATRHYVLDINEVLVTMDGTVGRTAKVINNKQVLAQRVGRLKAFFDSEFLYQFLNTGKFFNEMKIKSHGGTIKHISLTEIADYKSYVPQSETEQSKIGQYFKNLDIQIELLQTQIDKLNNIKKACFTKMFVAQD